MRFNLDDEYLDVLKEELIDAQRIALDEDGRILVRTGEATETTATVSLPTQPIQKSPPQRDQPTQGVPPPSAPHTPEAERRQLTVRIGKTKLLFTRAPHQ